MKGGGGQKKLRYIYFFTSAPPPLEVFVNGPLRVLHLLLPKSSKIRMFLLYLKIINIFLKNDICILK